MAPKRPLTHDPTIAILGHGSQALDQAAALSGSHVAIFVLTWDEVEHTRLLVEARRLSARVSVHHHSAARAAGLPFTRPTRAA
jgi:hypothetical protein